MNPVLVDGVLWVPRRAEAPGLIGDYMAPLEQSDPEYDEWMGEAVQAPRGVSWAAVETLTAAGWDENQHPRHPAGDEQGGKFAPKTTSVGGFLTFQIGGPDVVGVEAAPALDKEILDALGKYQRQFSSIHAPAVGLSSPYRRTAAGMALAREMWKATGGDIAAVARVWESGEQWGMGWDYALDEWDAAWQLEGLEPPKRIKDAIASATKEGQRWYPGGTERPPLSGNDLKAFEARTRWYRDRFREAYPEGIWAYRGISGKRAIKPWLTDQTLIGDVVEGPAWSLSSWSENPGVASTFAYGVKGNKPGILLKAPIRAEDIWMIPTIGGQGVMKVADVNGEYVVVNHGGVRKAEIGSAQRY